MRDHITALIQKCRILLVTGFVFLAAAVPVKANNEVSIAKYQQVQNQLNAMTSLVGLYSRPGLSDPVMASVEGALNEQLISLQLMNAGLNPVLGSVSQSTMNMVDNKLQEQQKQVMALFAWQQQAALAQALAEKQQELMVAAWVQQQAMAEAQLKALGLK